MSKYDKSISITHEDEGTYHRREVEPVQYTSSKPVTSYHTERYLVDDDHKPSRAKSSNKLVSKSGNYTSDEEDKDNFEEWTVSKRKVNHKTRQVETRVSRQLLVENGKVIADSGPQVTTRIKEDNKVEECEKEKTPKNKSKFEALEAAPEGPKGSCSGRVLGEKKEIQRVSREVREENMQYHDERFKELTGRDVHQRAIKAPHELITINDKHHSSESAPRGRMVHYSNRGKKYQDTDEILEVAKLAIDGSITKEVKRTHNHEEFSEDEKPDEKGEAEELRHKPIVQRSSRRHADYVNDFDDVRTPDASDNDEREEYDSHGRSLRVSKARKSPLGSSGPRHRGATKSKHRHDMEEDDPAFPRYDLDPLLNSLREEDYRPHQESAASQRLVKEHSLERHNNSRRRHDSSSASSSEDERAGRRHGRPQYRHHHHETTTSAAASGGRVEIPEEYRVNRQRLLAGKSSSRERSYSPHQRQTNTKTHKLTSSTLPSHGRNRKGDAATQAHLTDEEIEGCSVASSLSGTHAKTTQHLQRQSTPNASRRYYYGNAATANEKAAATTATKRRNSVSSCSSLSSIEDAKARQRQQGVRSRDSGFRSPHSGAARTDTPLSDHKHREQQIYSVSSKSKNGGSRHRPESGGGAASPTPTTGSAGQRSVKTTTTTVSAGLADRPLSRSDKRAAAAAKDGRSSRASDSKSRVRRVMEQPKTDDDEMQRLDRFDTINKRSACDTVSVSSLQGPNATKIKVPYRNVIEIQRVGASASSRQQEQIWQQRQQQARANAVEKSSSEMSFQEDIESLSKRLANIQSEKQPSGDNDDQHERKHFDYKTLVANVEATQSQSNKQIFDAYNVLTLEQNSPFQQRIFIKDNQNDRRSTNVETDSGFDNNNETTFNLDDYYVEYRATPVLVDESQLLTGGKRSSHCDQNDKPSTSSGMEDDDRISQASSCSLQSSRTYKIRTIGQAPDAGQASHQGNSNEEQEHSNDQQRKKPQERPIDFDENGNNKRPAAWIFDPRDGSSTAIVPPARPKRPETPKVDAKTEELAQSRGGRSYYLELIEPAGTSGSQMTRAAKRQRPGSIDSLYSRWTSQGALNSNVPTASARRPLAPVQIKSPPRVYRSTKELNSTIAQLEQNRYLNRINLMDPWDRQQQETATRRQLPFGGSPPSLGDKSKSSSCLLTVTKPSKYSIYGGFRKPGQSSKPVPRLSYSRAIGPRSQRKDQNAPKTPSRYLKMR